jgi:hypothetical protein
MTSIHKNPQTDFREPIQLNSPTKSNVIITIPAAIPATGPSVESRVLAATSVKNRVEVGIAVAVTV